MTKKKQIIHILGGGFNQLSLVKTAKELGLEVLVTDYFENPPCRALADHYERIDTTNKELSLEVAQKIGKKLFLIFYDTHMSALTSDRVTNFRMFVKSCVT